MSTNGSRVVSKPQSNVVGKYLESLVDELYMRFETKFSLDEKTGCWVWTGSKDANGYGRVSFFKRPHMAYRISYELYCDKIPDGMYLDHLCRNPSCVNPTHLEPVTLAENTRRGRGAEASRLRNLSKTHCKNGHELIQLGKQRGCRVCANERKRNYRELIGKKGFDLSGLKLGAVASSIARKARIHCKHGHEWDEKNTSMYNGARRCRACHRERMRRFLKLVA